MRAATFLWAGLALIAGAALFLLKYEVQSQNDRLVALKCDIRQTRETIHVLRAEWSYLNEPSRLRALSERHLKLTPQALRGMETVQALPFMDEMQEPPASPPALMAKAPSVPPVLPATPAKPAAPLRSASVPAKPVPVATKPVIAAQKPATVQRPAATYSQNNPANNSASPPTTGARPRGNVVVITSPALEQGSVIPAKAGP